MGLFASAGIPLGTTVARLGGRLVPGQELLGLLADAALDPGAAYVDTIAVADDLHLVIPPGEPIHFGNHSCDPNLWWSGPYDLVARRAIEADEELSNDYAMSTDAEDYTMVCSCGSPLCRGRVTGND
jgi:SET domain-containing protein